LGQYHDCPNAYEAKCRLKTIMFGWNFRENTTHVATEFEDNQPSTFLSAMLLSSVNRKKYKPKDHVEVEIPCLEESYESIYSPTEENWEEFYEGLTNIEKCEFGGKEYVCGFLAKKLQKM